ncbi:hypothetical protein [Pseudofrankia asymbiotica]|uniref:Regulatory protein n=1 Tax=Pseudofrankia asymbiotica TaxID=1834516 RepID=A0A1V2IA83_9ACTN|nr:hypothetical protein [Pseudofrankia asymbiotica]ONH29130.1 hypothetical protein BL253_17075 [Pseudofrankia asymbiotica]
MREIPVDPAAIVAAVVMGEPEASMYQGEHRANRDGVPLWEVQVTVAVAGSGASTLRVKVAAASAPRLTLGQPVSVVGLKALAWEMGSRHGLAFSAAEIRPVGAPAAGKRES